MCVGAFLAHWLLFLVRVWHNEFTWWCVFCALAEMRPLGCAFGALKAVGLSAFVTRLCGAQRSGAAQSGLPRPRCESSESPRV